MAFSDMHPFNLTESEHCDLLTELMANITVLLVISTYNFHHSIRPNCIKVNEWRIIHAIMIASLIKYIFGECTKQK